MLISSSVKWGRHCFWGAVEKEVYQAPGSAWVVAGVQEILIRGGCFYCCYNHHHHLCSWKSNIYLSLIFRCHVWLIIILDIFFVFIRWVAPSASIWKSRRSVLGVEYFYHRIFSLLWAWEKAKFILFQWYFFHFGACFGLLVSKLTWLSRRNTKLECVRATKFPQRGHCPCC